MYFLVNNDGTVEALPLTKILVLPLDMEKDSKHQCVLFQVEKMLLKKRERKWFHSVCQIGNHDKKKNNLFLLLKCA